MRIVVGTYEGLLYGWQSVKNEDEMSLKLIFGYTAHPGSIKSVALMAVKEGNTLLSGGEDEIIKIYNVKKRTEIGSLMHHSGAVTCLTYFGSTHVLSGSKDNTICIWRTSDWNCVHILGGHKAEINSIAVHPSGKLALSVSRDRTLRMWNLVKGRCAYIRKLDKEATSVFLSKNGGQYGLVLDKDVVLFSAINAELIGTLEHKERVCTAEFVTNEILVTAGADKFVYLWNTSGKLLRKFTHPAIKSRIRSISVVEKQNSTEYPYFIIATSSGLIQVWDLQLFGLESESNGTETLKKLQPVTSTFILGGSRVTCLSACITDSTEPLDTIPEVVETENTNIVEESAAEVVKNKKKLPFVPKVVVELDDNQKSNTTPKGKKRRKNHNKGKRKKAKLKANSN